MADQSRPFIVGLGGTPAQSSSTEEALRLALRAAEALGARTSLHDGAALSALPLYLTPAAKTSEEGQALVDDLRAADGVIIASPGYHGSISGVVKNALDYLEETARDPRVYLDGLPVGLIVTAYGWQATGSTLVALRSIVHALRAWPTPLGVAINSSGSPFKDGQCSDPAVLAQLDLVGRQVYEFAQLRVANRPEGAPPRP